MYRKYEASSVEEIEAIRIREEILERGEILSVIVNKKEEMFPRKKLEAEAVYTYPGRILRARISYDLTPEGDTKAKRTIEVSVMPEVVSEKKAREYLWDRHSKKVSELPIKSYCEGCEALQAEPVIFGDAMKLLGLTVEDIHTVSFWNDPETQDAVKISVRDSKGNWYIFLGEEE